jgi:hypothetical protein
LRPASSDPVLREFVFFLLLGAIFVSGWHGGFDPANLATGLSVARSKKPLPSFARGVAADRRDDMVRLVLFGQASVLG